MTHKKIKKIHGMVDIGPKNITQRVARAVSIIEFSEKAFNAFTSQGSPKGDIFETAKIAGIMAAKSTPAIIPMCHPLMLSKVTVTFKEVSAKRQIETTVEVACSGKTGVEMEALTAAAVASLTIYDMMKWADKGSVIKETKLVYKSGGKSGDFHE